MSVRAHCVTASYKITYLLVELDVGGLELLLNVDRCSRGAEMVRVLDLGERHALAALGRGVARRGDVGHGSHRGGLVLDVPNLVKVDVGDLFVLNEGRIMRGRVPRQLREVL